MDYEEIDVLDALLDHDNNEPIVMQDDNGKQITFDQVAVVPYEINGEKRLYCILKPRDISGLAADEAMVFFFDVDENGNSTLRLEEDTDNAKKVFLRYYELLEEANPALSQKVRALKKDLLSKV